MTVLFADVVQRYGPGSVAEYTCYGLMALFGARLRWRIMHFGHVWPPRSTESEPGSAIRATSVKARGCSNGRRSIRGSVGADSSNETAYRSGLVGDGSKR